MLRSSKSLVLVLVLALALGKAGPPSPSQPGHRRGGPPLKGGPASWSKSRPFPFDMPNRQPPRGPGSSESWEGGMGIQKVLVGLSSSCPQEWSGGCVWEGCGILVPPRGEPRLREEQCLTQAPLED